MQCCTMVEWSQFITFASSRVHWRGSLWINVLTMFIKPRKSFLSWSVTNVKTILLKTRKQFLSCSLWWHCPHTRRKCFWPPPLLSPLCWTQKEEYVGNVPMLHSLPQGRTGYGPVTSPNSAQPFRRRRLCGDCEMSTAVGWGGKEGISRAGGSELEDK